MSGPGRGTGAAPPVQIVIAGESSVRVASSRRPAALGRCGPRCLGHLQAMSATVTTATDVHQRPTLRGPAQAKRIRYSRRSNVVARARPSKIAPRTRLTSPRISPLAWITQTNMARRVMCCRCHKPGRLLHAATNAQLLSLWVSINAAYSPCAMSTMIIIGNRCRFFLKSGLQRLPTEEPTAQKQGPGFTCQSADGACSSRGGRTQPDTDSVWLWRRGSSQSR